MPSRWKSPLKSRRGGGDRIQRNGSGEDSNGDEVAGLGGEATTPSSSSPQQQQQQSGAGGNGKKKRFGGFFNRRESWNGAGGGTGTDGTGTGGTVGGTNTKTTRHNSISGESGHFVINARNSLSGGASGTGTSTNPPLQLLLQEPSYELPGLNNKKKTNKNKNDRDIITTPTAAATTTTPSEVVEPIKKFPTILRKGKKSTTTGVTFKKSLRLNRQQQQQSQTPKGSTTNNIDTMVQGQPRRHSDSSVLEAAPAVGSSSSSSSKQKQKQKGRRPRAMSDDVYEDDDNENHDDFVGDLPIRRKLSPIPPPDAATALFPLTTLKNRDHTHTHHHTHDGTGTGTGTGHHTPRITMDRMKHLRDTVVSALPTIHHGSGGTADGNTTGDTTGAAAPTNKRLAWATAGVDRTGTGTNASRRFTKHSGGGGGGGYAAPLPAPKFNGLSLSAVSDIEKLAQKAGTNADDEAFKVMPDYAYPNTKFTREQLRTEMNKESSYFHDLRPTSMSNPNASVANFGNFAELTGLAVPQEEIGSLTVEILQCFGIPRPDLLKETSAFCVGVCGGHAFKTDVMPPVANPMWLSRMRRACIFPIYEAYARLYVGVFCRMHGEHNRDGFAGRIVIDISRLRPFSTYDITLPLRQSNHVYTRQQRGAIRLRVHLSWRSERNALLSYLPKSGKTLLQSLKQPNETVTVPCCDAKAFQNVARVVHGKDMPGKFSMKHIKATIREINFTRIHIMRYIRKRESRAIMQWKNPFLSGFVFIAWMHCVIRGTMRYIPGHIITLLLLYIWRNYSRYAIQDVYHNGFLAPTWEEMFLGLLRGTSPDKRCIHPLNMERKDPSTSISAIEHFKQQEKKEENKTTTTTDHVNAPLHEIADAFRVGVQTSRNYYYMKTYPNSFKDSTGVDFLIKEGYATTRDQAVEIGKRLQKEVQLFDHVTRQHAFGDDGNFFYFKNLDNSEYVMKTHNPWGVGLFKILGFYNLYQEDTAPLLPGESPPPLTAAEAHLEMPFATGIDHPRFTVKESLVIRSKESRNLLQSMQAAEELEDMKLLSGAAADDLESVSRGHLLSTRSSITASHFHSSLATTSTLGLAGSSMHSQNSNDSVDLDLDVPPHDGPMVVTKTKILPKPPYQDIDVEIKGDKKLTDVLQEIRHSMHGLLGHMFNDRVYQVGKAQPKKKKKDRSKSYMRNKTKSGRFGRSVVRGKEPPSPSPVGPGRRTHVRMSSNFGRSASNDSSPHMTEKEEKLFRATKKDEYERLLQLGKYSHPNPIVAKIAVLIQPIAECALGWLCLVRSIFNVFTWRDPILSFWVTLIGPLVVIALHLFPWRIFLGVLGIFLVGPQNWVLRLIKEKNGEIEDNDLDTIQKTSIVQQDTGGEPEELQYFSSYAPDNRPIKIDEMDPAVVRQVVIPHSPLMYNRFYDWPPEQEYARVQASEQPQSDPDVAAEMNVWMNEDNSVDFNVWSSDVSVNLNSKGRPLKKLGKAIKGVKGVQKVSNMVKERRNKRKEGIPEKTPFNVSFMVR